MNLPEAHLFYPENDLALARDIARYTAPPAAVQLRRSGLTLPFFYGNDGDAVVAQGVDAQWLGRIRDAFGPDVSLWHSGDKGFVPSPWGWSKASRQYFADLGFPASELPSDVTLDAIRELSHRRTAARVASMVAADLPFAVAPPASELSTLEEINEFIREHPDGAVLKLPWSSSGRGLVATDPATAAQQQGMFAGMLARQGTVMAEPRYRRLLDFAMLFTIEGGICRYAGMSVFSSVGLGTYAGNELAPEAELRARVAALCGADRLEAIKAALTKALAEVAGMNYSGPLGVDMMAVAGAGFPVVPVSEINFRMTMGHLCHRFYSRYAVDGTRGTFTVRANGSLTPSGAFAAAVRGGRMEGGTLDLAQPGCRFSFLITLT